MKRAADQPPSAPRVEPCPLPDVPPARALIDNLPYAAMLILGAAVFWQSWSGREWATITALGYVAYGVLGAFWIMFFVCPYCHFYATRWCPCGYGQVAAKLRRRRDGEQFAHQFRRHIPVIVPLWFAPPIAAGFALFRQWSWPLLALVLIFIVNAFVVLPLVSRAYGCAKCPQKDGCPWMGGCKGSPHGTAPHHAGVLKS